MDMTGYQLLVETMVKYNTPESLAQQVLLEVDRASRLWDRILELEEQLKAYQPSSN